MPTPDWKAKETQGEEAAPKVTLEIDTSCLIPLPKQMWKSNCSNCDKPQGMWRLIDPTKRLKPPMDDGSPEDGESFFILCSLCWLYTSNWGKNPKRASEIEATITELEGIAKHKFLRDAEGNLLSPSDADNVLGLIALASRRKFLQAKLAWRKGIV
jgi:hypothetical protein